MNPLLLSKLAEMRSRSLEHAITLRKRATTNDASGQQWMALALQELDVAHEELRVVEEELHSQTDELTAIYGALEFERRRYRDLFEGAPTPYLVTDGTGVVQEANRLACKLLNIRPQYLVGKPITLYIAGSDRSLIRDVLSLVASAAEVSSFEVQLQPRANLAPVRVTASVRRAQGEMGETATLRWILHESPNPAHLKLERALADERAARTHAERALERRNEQLAFIAHELRNPLNSTAGWIEILNQGDMGPGSREHVVEVLSRNVQTLSRMVEELVDQTRIVQGVIVLDWSETNFRMLLEQVCDDAVGLAHAKHVNFKGSVDARIGTFRCDANRLRQALGNVVGNAIKFTPSGGSVTLEAKLGDKTIECVVSDTGPGIAFEHIRTIFEPFIRVDATGTSTGLGLGLNIARKLIELHGGTITAESEGLQRGATFRIHLPLRDERPVYAPADPPGGGSKGCGQQG
jgi:PAS domain S-box-containing protein